MYQSNYSIKTYYLFVAKIVSYYTSGNVAEAKIRMDLFGILCPKEQASRNLPYEI